MKGHSPCREAAAPAGRGAQRALPQPPPGAERGESTGTVPRRGPAALPAPLYPGGGAAAPPPAPARPRRRRRRRGLPGGCSSPPNAAGPPPPPALRFPPPRTRRPAPFPAGQGQPPRGCHWGRGARKAVRGRGGPAAAGGAPFPGRRGAARRYAAGRMAGASAVSPLVCAFQRGARAWRMGHRPLLCRRHFNRPHLQCPTCCRQRGSPGAHTPPEGLGGEDGDGSASFAAV